MLGIAIVQADINHSPNDEALRLKRLNEYQILGTPPERAFDEIVLLAAGLLDAPIAFICLAAADCHWFKARIGIALVEVPRSISFCDYTLRGNSVFTIPDARADPEFANNPTVTGELNVGFYTGVPLIDGDGFKLGTLAVLDTKARPNITDRQKAALDSLARIATDRLELRRLSTGLIEAEKFFRRLFDNNPLPMMVYDIETMRFLGANDAAVSHYGFTREQFLAMSLLDIRPPECREEDEKFIRSRRDDTSDLRESVHWKADSTRFVASVFAYRGLDYQGRKAGLLTTIDVTERRRHEAEIQQLAHQDPLTGLPNRLMFNKCLVELLEEGSDFAVLLIDLDNFKAVNDTLGHPTGDALIAAAAGRLKQNIRERDFVARLGGDEFAVIQMPIASPVDVETLAHRLIAAITEPFDINGHRLSIGLSAGITRAPHDGRDGQTLLQNADLALYRAKALGRGQFCHFVPQMQLRVIDRRNLEIELRKAHARNDFTLDYQPLIDLRTSTTTGYEALLRWFHPERGQVPPADFIPILEDAGFIIPVAGWTLEEACRDAARWHPNLSVAVNLSARQFKDRAVVASVRNALARSGIEPARLELEVTESVLLEDSGDTLHALNALRELGVQIVLDDFGTGYSSLSYLRKFPVDKIKIDRSFITTLIGTPQSREIIRAVIAIGASLDIRVLAEGIETKEELDALRQLGCDFGQGYYFGKPVPAASIATAHRGVALSA